MAEQTATTTTAAAPATTTTTEQKAPTPTFNESSSFETRDDSPAGHLPSRTFRLLESARLGLTILALLLGITIFSTTADAIAVFNKTHVSADYNLPLWPFDFNLGPNIAFATAGVVVTFFGAVVIAALKVPFLRRQAPIHALLSLTGPFLSLAAVITATAYYYTTNKSSTTDTLQNWSCQWSDIDLDSEPHFGKLCKESKAGLYLTIVLIPIQTAIFVLASMAVFAERKAAAWHRRGRVGEEGKGSPAMS